MKSFIRLLKYSALGALTVPQLIGQLTGDILPHYSNWTPGTMLIGFLSTFIILGINGIIDGDFQNDN